VNVRAFTTAARPWSLLRSEIVGRRGLMGLAAQESRIGRRRRAAGRAARGHRR
jgi:hypothetical protein